MGLPVQSFPSKYISGIEVFTCSLDTDLNHVIDYYAPTAPFLEPLRDCQQITFVTLDGFRPLSKPPPTPPVLNGQYQDQ